MIAADVNNSQDITGADLVELRKLILGIYLELPDNSSWRFVGIEHEFINELNPWQEKFAENYEIQNLSTNMDVDFIGVKIGDVNGTAITNSQENNAGIASNRWPLVLELGDVNLAKDELVTIPIYSRNYEGISGWQTSLEFDSDKVEIVEVKSASLEMNAANYNFNAQEEGWMTMSYHNTILEDHDKEEILFHLVVRAKESSSSVELFDLSSKVTKAEAYRGYNEVVGLNVDHRINEQVTISSVNPNPWITYTDIEFAIPEDSKAVWEFYDVNGRILHKITDNYKSGEQVLRLNRNDINGSGIIYMKLTTDQGIAEYKMILIE